MVNNPVDIAEKVNDFFVNIGPETENCIPKVVNSSPGTFLKNRNQFNFVIAHISEEEVVDIINSLSNKSTGIHSIPLNLLIIIMDIIIIPLCLILNMSLSTGTYPDKLKIVKVIPIHKGGCTQDLNNFRPISLLSIFDKIIEKIIHSKLYMFLEANNILFNQQFWFRKNNSTTYALIQITERIKESIDNGKFGCGLFIDLRKAFDTVNHEILLLKLEHYGIRGILLDWFKSYLSNRKQFVCINGISSSLKDISCGVPQGSVLGPLLFLLYINDLPNISKILNFYLFADDTNIYYENENLAQMEKIINLELKKLSMWLKINRLSLNIGKTNFIIFHPFNKPLKYRITLKIERKAIMEKSYIKYLGIIIDSTLTWKQHIFCVSNKISRALGVMCKLRSFLNQKMLINLYYSIFYSHIAYSIQTWGNAGGTELNKIFIIQKRAVRLLSNNFNTLNVSSDPLFLKLDILKIKDIFLLQISKFIFNGLRKNTPSNFESWFKLNHSVHSHRTRSNFNDVVNLEYSNNLHILYARTSFYGLKLIKVFGPKFWNSIPLHIRSAVNIKHFSKVLKLYLVNIIE